MNMRSTLFFAWMVVVLCLEGVGLGFLLFNYAGMGSLLPLPLCYLFLIVLDCGKVLGGRLLVDG